MGRIDDQWRGIVRVEAFGAFPEGLLNRAAGEGVELWNVSKAGESSLCFTMYEKHLDSLSQIAEKCGCVLNVLAARGGRSAVKTAKRRGWLLFGLAAMLVGLIASSLFVWSIELRGTEHLSRGQILRALEDCGVGIGCFWPGLDTERVRSDMMLRLPEIGWMAVNVSGSRAVLLIRERQEKPELWQESGQGDLLARKSGIVRRVSALSGLPEVQPGQAVTAGETLIRGRRGSITGTGESVRAKGDVIAETWTEHIAVCPALEDRKESAGAGHGRVAILFGKRRLNLYLGSRKTLDGYDKLISETALGVPGLFSLPIRIVRERLIPYRLSSAPCLEPEKMAEHLLRKLESDTEGQILQFDFVSGESGGLFSLTLRAHCIENIAVPG